MTIYQLFDFETEEELGLVNIISELTENSVSELKEAWEDFNQLEEHELEPKNVDDFIVWNNENYVTQIERVYTEFL